MSTQVRRPGEIDQNNQGRESFEARAARQDEPKFSEDLRKAFPEVEEAPNSEEATQNQARNEAKEPDQDNGTLNEHATEQELVNLLRVQLPPLRCVGSVWYTYENGVWGRGTKDIFRPQALAIQNARKRTDRKATAILSHLESESQIHDSTFLPFYKFAEDGAILINCRNGVLRVTGDGVLTVDHSPDFLFTGQVTAAFDPTAKAPFSSGFCEKLCRIRKT